MAHVRSEAMTRCLRSSQKQGLSNHQDAGRERADSHPWRRHRQRRSPRSWAHRLRRHARAYLFLLPSGLILLVFVVYPIAESFWMSLHNWSFFSSLQLIGLQELQDHVARLSLLERPSNTAIYTVLVVPLQVGLGLALAVALQRNTLVNKFFRSVYFFPVISSLATMGIVWKFLLDPEIGIITHVHNPRWPAQHRLPTEHNMGASFGDAGRRVEKRGLLDGDLPRRSPRRPRGADRGGRARRGGAVGAVPSSRAALAPPDLALCLDHLDHRLDAGVRLRLRHDRGGPIFHTETIVYYIYEAAFDYFQPGYAAAISWVLFVLILFLSMFQLRLFRYTEVD